MPYIPNPPSQEGVGEPLDPTKGLVTLEAYWTVRKSRIPPSLGGKFIATNVGSNPESGSKFAGEGIWLCLSPSPFSFCRTDKFRRLVFPHRRGWDLSFLRFSFCLEVTSGILDFCLPPWPAYCLLGTCSEGAPGSVALTPRPQMWKKMRIRYTPRLGPCGRWNVLWINSYPPPRYRERCPRTCLWWILCCLWMASLPMCFSVFLRVQSSVKPRSPLNSVSVKLGLNFVRYQEASPKRMSPVASFCHWRNGATHSWWWHAEPSHTKEKGSWIIAIPVAEAFHHYTIRKGFCCSLPSSYPKSSILPKAWPF